MGRWKLITMGGVVAIFVLIVGGLALAAPAIQSLGAPDAAKGALVYKNNCAACHGAQGEGKLGIPNVAGAAGHVQQLGIPAELAGAGIIKLLRDGIAGNMPAFPPAILSDEDIANLGAYLLTLPPTTGANLYTANCALCHGSQGQGSVGPALAGAAERFAGLGLSKLQVLKGFPDLVRNGIPGKMPGNPQLADVETARLGDFLWNLGSWEADFQARHGRAPSSADRADRQWSLQFAQRTGRTPTEQDWVTHSEESRSFQQVTALDVSVGAPPAGGWKWQVTQRTSGSTEVVEVNNNPNDHGNDWVFHVVKGSHELETPGGSVVQGAGEAEFLAARGVHTHRFAAQSDVLQFQPRIAAGTPPSRAHGGDQLLYSNQPLATTAGVSYRLRVRDFTLAPGVQSGNIEVGPAFIYVSEGTLAIAGAQANSASAGQVVEVAATPTLVIRNSGATNLRLVLADLHQ